jgi:20S proteasome alpha/beta subunit
MICKDGVVLGADRQVTVPEGYKYEEQKILCSEAVGWRVLLTYAGDPGFAKEVHQELPRRLDIENINSQVARQKIDEILTGMGRPYGDVGRSLLIVVHVKDENACLWKFDGKWLHSANGFDCLGVGDSSLIRYLSHTLYSLDMAAEDGAKVAVYLVSKANKYVDKCSGGPDIVTLTHGGEVRFLDAAKVRELIITMENEEPGALNDIIGAGRISTPS